MMKLWGCDVIAMVLCNVHVGMLNSFLFFSLFMSSLVLLIPLRSWILLFKAYNSGSLLLSHVESLLHTIISVR